jgi:hypothetical protein
MKKENRAQHPLQATPLRGLVSQPDLDLCAVLI